MGTPPIPAVTGNPRQRRSGMTDPDIEHPSPFIDAEPSGNSRLLKLNTCPICYQNLRDESVSAHIARDDHTWSALMDARDRHRQLNTRDVDIDTFHATGLDLEGYLSRELPDPRAAPAP